eukprot:701062-Pleurochrysis_carterae.AAC.1
MRRSDWRVRAFLNIDEAHREGSSCSTAKAGKLDSTNTRHGGNKARQRKPKPCMRIQAPACVHEEPRMRVPERKGDRKAGLRRSCESASARACA